MLLASVGCNGSLPISPEHFNYVIGLYECFNDNALGKLWTSASPFLFPFIVEYRYLLCMYISKNRRKSVKHNALLANSTTIVNEFVPFDEVFCSFEMIVIEHVNKKKIHKRMRTTQKAAQCSITEYCMS